jgi:hypothetical protein
MKYSDKLRDPRWQKKRLEIMQRDEFSCQLCGDTESPLNVHHYFYEKNNEPWDYNSEDLVTVCESCHEAESREANIAGNDLLTKLKQKHFTFHELMLLEKAFDGIIPCHVLEVIITMIGWILKDTDTQKEMLSRYFDYLADKSIYKNGEDNG